MHYAEMHSGCLLLVFLAGERAVQKLNAWVELAADEGKNTHDVGILGTWVAVEETVQFFAMSVEIQDESHLSLFAYLLDKALDCRHFRATWIFFANIPFSVEVLSCEVSSVVSESNSIWIYHWQHIHHVVFQ